MPIRWIAAAARELALDPLDAVELLAAKQNYPMNGLVDDDTFLLLKRYSEGHGVESTGARGRAEALPLPPPPPPVPAASRPPELPKGVDATASTSVTSVTSVTSPIPLPGDDEGGAESKTVIMPAFKQE